MFAKGRLRRKYFKKTRLLAKLLQKPKTEGANQVPEELCPVACPVCSESQNTLPGDFDPNTEPFGPVHCMVCGHAFSRTNYMTGLTERRKQLKAMRGPASK